MVAFRGVIEHHIKDHFDAGPMQRLDHVAELVHRTERIQARAIGAVRREEGNWCITPVIHQSRGAVLNVELEHRQKLDRCDAQALEIRDFLDEARKRPPYLLVNAGTGVTREASYMHLIDDRLRGRSIQWCIALPIIGGTVDDDALHRCAGVISRTMGSIARVPCRNDNAAPIWIEQYLGGIEAHSIGGIEWSPCAEAIDLAGSHPGHE